MLPLISFAIPLYNKGGHIADVVESVHSLCAGLGGRYEICISDNASTDIEGGLRALLESRDLFHNCKIARLDNTISTQENWLFALAMCSAPLVKLQLADDRALPFDIEALLRKFDDQELAFVIGKTMPVYTAACQDLAQFSNDYYHQVNLNRRFVLAGSDQLGAVQALLAKNPFNSNPLGDINGLVMRRDCVDWLREPIYKSAFPVILCWPDWEIHVKLILARKGAFSDHYLSEFRYNDSSPAVRALTDPEFKVRVYDEPFATVRLSPFIHPDIRRLVLPHLSAMERSRLLLRTWQQISSDARMSWRELLLLTAKDRLIQGIIATAIRLKRLRASAGRPSARP
jgi:glycosyltransferase involved in cell wall biosynthesis